MMGNKKLAIVSDRFETAFIFTITSLAETLYPLDERRELGLPVLPPLNDNVSPEFQIWIYRVAVL